MKIKPAFVLSFASLTALGQAPAAKPVPPATPQYRPAYHFTPVAHWMNDPNGLIYYPSTPQADVTLLFDSSSVELFADNGLTVMTALFFPTQPLSTLKLRSNGNFTVHKLTCATFATANK